MTEFGHIAVRAPGFCADIYGAGPFVITAGARSWRFEDSDRFGPMLVKQNSEPCANPLPGKRSPFWRAHGLWVWGGRRLAEDGATCIWDEPKPTVLRLKPGRIIETVDPGEPNLPHWLERTVWVDEEGNPISTHPERKGGGDG